MHLQSPGDILQKKIEMLGVKTGHVNEDNEVYLLP